MFRVFKYIFIATLYKKSKKSFITLLASIVTLALVSFMLNDFIEVSQGVNVYMLLVFKWLVIVILLSLIVYNTLRIINIATNPFETKKESSTKEQKKNRILEKDELLSKSEIIMKKYMKGSSDEKK